MPTTLLTQVTAGSRDLPQPGLHAPSIWQISAVQGNLWCECNLQGGRRGQGHLMGLPRVRGSMICRAPGPYEVLTEGERA